MIRVSAIIPVYNGEATIERAIRSVLDQNFDGTAVIVVDDGSTDSTMRILKRWESQVRVVHQVNSGPSVARNNGVRVASGKYLAFLDADDVWLPGKLSKMVGTLDAAPDAVLAYSNFTPVGDSGHVVEESFITAECAHAPSMADMLTRWWPILTSAVVMRRDVFDRCGGFSEEFRTAGYEDPFLWLVAREHGEFIYVPEPLMVYRAETAFHRMDKYGAGCAIFIRLVRQRYGRGGRRLVKEVLKARVSKLGHEGLLAMRRGDTKTAREAFLMALRTRPLHLRSALRFLRTFLPPSAARALTGRTRSAP